MTPTWSKVIAVSAAGSISPALLYGHREKRVTVFPKTLIPSSLGCSCSRSSRQARWLRLVPLCVACGLYRRLGLAPAVYSDLRGPISREFSAAPVSGMRQQTDNGRCWSPAGRGGLLIRRPAKRHNAAGRGRADANIAGQISATPSLRCQFF